MNPQTEKPLRVLHVLGGMQRGGAEMRTLDIIGRLDPARFRCDFCALGGRAGPLDGAVADLGGHVYHLGLGPAFAPRFVALLRREGYDVVHSHVHTFSGAVLALARLAGVPLKISHFRNTDDGRGDGVVRRARRGLMKALIDCCADKVLGVCAGALDAVWGPRWHSDSRFEVVYNGLDLERFTAETNRDAVRAELDPGDGPVCIHVGRFDPPKNHVRLIGIFAALRRLVPGIRLLLVGRGGNDLERDALARAAELGVDDAVLALGERDDVPRLLAAADLMIFPSLWEGLPGVVLEALASGLPVLASDLPGVREISERTGGVKVLSLDEPDSDWAAAAADILEKRPATLLEPGSPFDVAVAAERMAAIWEGRPVSVENSK